LRLCLLPALLLALLGAACAGPPEELLLIPAAVKGASTVTAVDISVRGPARAMVAALDERLRTRRTPPAGATPDKGDYDALPFDRMTALVIADAARKAGLTSGRQLRLRVEIDMLKIPNAAAALVGSDDRLAGSVFIRDAATDEALGQLYIDITGPHDGLIGLATRGGIREQLAERFAAHIVKALAGKSPQPR
jgi:hypothetical protein